MDKAAVLGIVGRFGAALERGGVRPSKIVLYGSFANGRWHEWSDIDVVVVSSDFERMDHWQRIDALTEAIFQVHQPIEAVGMTPEEWGRGDSLIAQFAREGEEVYPL